MDAHATIGPVRVTATQAASGIEVAVVRGVVRLIERLPEWRSDLAGGVRWWARRCFDDLSTVGAWSYWGRRAGRWTLLVEQMPTCAVWNVAYRVGAKAVVVAHGRVQPMQSVRCFHGQRSASEAVMRARVAAEEATIEWVRQVRRALCASLGEASRSGVAA